MNPIRLWNHFWFAPTSAKPLAAMRIIFGLLVLFNLALLWVEIDYWFTDAGLLQGTEAQIIAGPMRFSPFLYWQDGTSVRIGFALIGLVAALFTIGFWSRTMAVLLYLGLVAIHHRNIPSTSGADVLLITLAFNLMLGPVGAIWSVDAWLRDRRRGTAAEALIAPWSVRLIQVQISMIYTVAGVLKANGTSWINGTALHWVFNNSEVRRFDFSFLSHYPTIINLMTYSALAIEIGLAGLIWFRAARPWILFAGIALHTGIFFSINIPLFGELMMMGYLAFLTPPEFERLMAAIDVRRWWKRAPQAVPVSAPAALPDDTRLDGPSEFWGPHQVITTQWGPAADELDHEFAGHEA